MSIQFDDVDYNSQSSSSEEFDFMKAVVEGEVTTQLAAAGLVGVAAAAAIVSAKKRKRPYGLHSFETNPSLRKRLQNRLLRQLQKTLDEFVSRVGQQAIVLVATPGRSNMSYKVYGAKPLKDVIKNLQDMVMEKLEKALVHQAPPSVQEDLSLFVLPPLIIEGIPTSLEKMTQAQLKIFIPLMLKYSTGREKPGWGRESTRPPWWPQGLPWANVRRDPRREDEKRSISWKHKLRQIVVSCYMFHGREDLLPAFTKKDENVNANTQQYRATVPHTITSNNDTVCIVQADPNNPFITLSDGTTVHLQEMMATIQTQQGDRTPIHTIEAISKDDGFDEIVDLDSVTEATLNSEGQIIFTGEDGQVCNVMIATSQHVQHLQTSQGTVGVTPVVQVLNVEPNNEDSVETLSETAGITTYSMTIQETNNDPQVVQVWSLKDATVLTKAIQDVTEDATLSDQ